MLHYYYAVCGVGVLPNYEEYGEVYSSTIYLEVEEGRYALLGDEVGFSEVCVINGDGLLCIPYTDMYGETYFFLYPRYNNSEKVVFDATEVTVETVYREYVLKIKSIKLCAPTGLKKARRGYF